MDTTYAIQKARTLLDEYELFDWTVKYDRAVTRFGQTVYGKKLITLSRPLTECNNEEEFTDTVLHEIAHALLGPNHGHDQTWQKVAKSIGCNGERVKVAATPEPKYVAYCDTCGRKSTRNRRSSSRLACSYCCYKFNYGKFSEEFVLTYVENA